MDGGSTDEQNQYSASLKEAATEAVQDVQDSDFRLAFKSATSEINTWSGSNIELLERLLKTGFDKDPEATQRLILSSVLPKLDAESFWSKPKETDIRLVNMIEEFVNSSSVKDGNNAEILLILNEIKDIIGSRAPELVKEFKTKFKETVATSAET